MADYKAEKVGTTKGGPKEAGVLKGIVDQKKSVMPQLDATKHLKK